MVKLLSLKPIKEIFSQFPEMEFVEPAVIDNDSTVTFGIGTGGRVKYRFCKCGHCALWFKPKGYMKNGSQCKFCSKICYSESMKIVLKCKQCGEKIQNKHSVKISDRIYCSNKCSAESKKNIKLSSEVRKALSEGRKKSDKCKGPNLYNWKGGFKVRSKANSIKRYNRIKGLEWKIDPEFLKRLLKAQDGVCFYCEKDLSEYKAIEHLTPISRGGDNEPYNLVYACKSCNSKKRSKTLEEYAIANRRFDWLNKFEYVFAGAIY